MIDDIKVLIFKLGVESFALDINGVERIIEFEEPTSFLNLNDSSFIEGIIKYEEKIIPILNITKKIGIKEEKDENKKIIVMKENERKFGIVVDKVVEVKNIEKNRIEKISDIIPNINSKCIEKIIRLENKIVILLKLDEILKKEEEKAVF